MRRGEKINGLRFAVRECKSDVTKSGKNAGQRFVRGRVIRADLPGDMPFVIWGATAEQAERIRPDTVISVHGYIGEYEGELQVVADSGKDVEIVDPGDINPSEFLPRGPHKAKELFETFKVLFFDTVKDPEVKRLIEHFFSDKTFKIKYLNSPAAMRIHHAWINGLPQHAVEMAKVAELICSIYPWSEVTNIDIVKAGILLHDAAKTLEIEGTVSYQYSNMGKWFGHVNLGQQMLDRLQAELNLPENLYLELRQMIASHHTKEYGAEVNPASANGWVLHLADMVSAKMTCVWQAIHEAVESGTAQDGWTDKVWALDNTQLYIGWDERLMKAAQKAGQKEAV